jgi:DNA-binding transcriptional ArsR family regulator
VKKRETYRGGEIFRPYKKFTGLFVPEGLARCTSISPGAKLVYGRLVRYSGQNGECHPALGTLAAEVGLKKRQVQNHLNRLEEAKLIRRIPRRSGRRQTSNAYVFLWHPLFEEGVNKAAHGGVQEPTPGPMQDHAHKESQREESHLEEKVRDLDSLPQIAKPRDSRQDPICAKYPRLRTALSEYMITPDDSERVEPSDRIVVDVMDAAAGASEEEVIQCIHYLNNERGLKPGTRHGPRGFSWFKSVVGDYFQQKSNREVVFVRSDDNHRNQDVRLSKAEFDAMTDAIEID